VHDCSDGGLLVAIAEMAMASGIGVSLETSPGGIPPHAFWFGEDQARYVVTAPALALPEIEAAAKAAGVSVMRLGLTGGEQLTLPGERPIWVDKLKARHESWLPDYMAAKN
jgi:phosphoribosylformylglycinamidine synthase